MEFCSKRQLRHTLFGIIVHSPGEVYLFYGVHSVCYSAAQFCQAFCCFRSLQFIVLLRNFDTLFILLLTARDSYGIINIVV